MNCRVLVVANGGPDREQWRNRRLRLYEKDRSNLKIRHLSVPVAAAVAGVGFVGFAHPAAAAVQRNQIQTLNYTVIAEGSYTHQYTVSPDPCDAGFTGTGGYYGRQGSLSQTPLFTETLSGHVGGAPAPGVPLTYTDQYNDGSDYTYTLTGTFTDTSGDFVGTAIDSDSQYNIPVTGQITGASQTNYANHGQFVSANPNKNDAAHSCVGMPYQSHQQ